jgi:hypothetical protein
VRGYRQHRSSTARNPDSSSDVQHASGNAHAGSATRSLHFQEVYLPSFSRPPRERNRFFRFFAPMCSASRDAIPTPLEIPHVSRRMLSPIRLPRSLVPRPSSLIPVPCSLDPAASISRYWTKKGTWASRLSTARRVHLLQPLFRLSGEHIHSLPDCEAPGQGIQ